MFLGFFFGLIVGCFLGMACLAVLGMHKMQED